MLGQWYTKVMKGTLNKTIIKFKHKGGYYEIDWMTDLDWADGYREYDIFNGRGKSATCVGHISSKQQGIGILTKMAKEELNNIEV